MCGWLFASMSGLTRTATRAVRPSRVAIASSRASSPADSTLIALTPSATAHSSSAGVLPTPVKTMCDGLEPGLARDLDFPDGVRVHRAAQLAQQARDRQRRVRLQRVVHGVRVAVERRVDRPVPLAQHGRAVDVDGRPFGGGDGRERHAVTDEVVVSEGLPVEAGEASRLGQRDTLFYSTTCMSSDPPTASPHPGSPGDAVEALIQRCLQGDQLAWEQIVRQYWRKVFNVAYKFVGKHDAGRGSDAGHLSEDLQVARHVRSPRELPDLADQHQPQSLHRPLPQRAQGARDDRSRRGRERAVAALARSGAGGRARAAGPRRAAAAGDGGAAGHAADGGADARHPGTVVPGDCRQAAAAGRHRQVAHQPRPHRAGAPDPQAARRRFRSEPRAVLKRTGAN